MFFPGIFLKKKLRPYSLLQWETIFWLPTFCQTLLPLGFTTISNSLHVCNQCHPFSKLPPFQRALFLLKVLMSFQSPKLEVLSLPCLLILFSTIVFLVFFLFQKSPSILITALSSLDYTSSHYYCRLELQLPAPGCSGSNAPSQSHQVSLPENRKRQEEHTLKS